LTSSCVVDGAVDVSTSVVVVDLAPESTSTTRVALTSTALSMTASTWTITSGTMSTLVLARSEHRMVDQPRARPSRGNPQGALAHTFVVGKVPVITGRSA